MTDNKQLNKNDDKLGAIAEQPAGSEDEDNMSEDKGLESKEGEPAEQPAEKPVKKDDCQCSES